MKGAIIIHGLTGTPSTMAIVTEALARRDFRVITPLLPGHGTTVEELATVKWQDWFYNVCNAYDQLVASGVDEVFGVGISLGSLLTLQLVLKGNRMVKKIACLGTPLKLSPMLEHFLLPLSHIPPIRQLVRMSKKSWEESVADEMGRKIYQGTSYSKIPVKTVWELQKLQKEVIKNLPQLNIPALLMHSRLDKVAPPQNVEFFCKSISFAPKVVWLERSEHVITLDYERDIVAQQIAQFFSA